MFLQKVGGADHIWTKTQNRIRRSGHCPVGCRLLVGLFVKKSRRQRKSYQLCIPDEGPPAMLRSLLKSQTSCRSKRTLPILQQPPHKTVSFFVMYINAIFS
jgi:hypothetical protein